MPFKNRRKDMTFRPMYEQADPSLRNWTTSRDNACDSRSCRSFRYRLYDKNEIQDLEFGPQKESSQNGHCIACHVVEYKLREVVIRNFIHHAGRADPNNIARHRDWDGTGNNHQ